MRAQDLDRCRSGVEREKGLEPSTFCLGTAAYLQRKVRKPFERLADLRSLSAVVATGSARD